MIYQNVQLHNFAEYTTQDDGSIVLQRLPEEVRQYLNPRSQEMMLMANQSEIRFVFEGDRCEITLSCPQAEGGFDMMIFFGLYQNQRYRIGNEKTTITIDKHPRLRAAQPESLVSSPFSPHVCRLIMWVGQVQLHSIKGEGIRPPRPDELPEKTLLTYGTSITTGHRATAPHLGYAPITARLLGMDLLNFGSSGSAQTETQLADYLASRKDWDIASLALSVNMRHIALDEFSRRVSHMVNTVAGSDISRPVFCITLWPYYDDLKYNGTPPDDPGKGTSEEKRQALRDAVAACPHPNVHLLEGPELLTDSAGLADDQLHPGDFGMIQMGQNLAAAIRNKLGLK